MFKQSWRLERLMWIAYTARKASGRRGVEDVLSLIPTVAEPSQDVNLPNCGQSRCRRCRSAHRRQKIGRFGPDSITWYRPY